MHNHGLFRTNEWVKASHCGWIRRSGASAYWQHHLWVICDVSLMDVTSKLSRKNLNDWHDTRLWTTTHHEVRTSPLRENRKPISLWISHFWVSTSCRAPAQVTSPVKGQTQEVAEDKLMDSKWLHEKRYKLEMMHIYYSVMTLVAFSDVMS